MMKKMYSLVNSVNIKSLLPTQNGPIARIPVRDPYHFPLPPNITLSEFALMKWNWRFQKSKDARVLRSWWPKFLCSFLYT